MSILKEEKAKQEKEKALTKDRLVGMKVINAKGRVIGEIEDIAFTVGTTPVSMVMILKTKEGGSKEIPMEEVQAAGDFVILKPEKEASTAPAAMTNCPSCGGPLEYIQQYQRWYCRKCQKYA